MIRRVIVKTRHNNMQKIQLTELFNVDFEGYKVLCVSYESVCKLSIKCL